MKGRLTERQREVLGFIQSESRRRGYPPTTREIAKHFGFRSPKAVTDHLRALERKGYLQREPFRARGIRVHRPNTRSSIPAFQSGIPLVGSIAAGSPILAVENIEDTLPVDPKLFCDSGEVFALRVRGESMIGAGIQDGDLVLIRRQDWADNGEIVAVLIGEEATLKRFYREHHKDQDRIRLQPENSAMRPLYILPDAAPAMIVGKAVGLIRTLKA